ncbi:delta-12 fatty acid desaturas-like protein [Nemania sp. NC0429]|nr:delta-12 fatty acid desaturas-like protein [Nemania sp. NC0429]
MPRTYITETVHRATVKDGAIPQHCFEQCMALSMAYVAFDMVQYVALLATTIWLHNRAGFWASFAIRYLVYPFLAALPLTGLWVNGHECGHGAFSKTQTVNNAVGLILHSALLAPYFPWRSSHARHHQYANNMAADLNYVPLTRAEYDRSQVGRMAWQDLGEDSPAMVSCRILLQQLLGWPWYLLSHITAGPESSPRKSRGWWDNSHFLPSSSLFRPSEWLGIVISDLGIGSMIYCLYVLGELFGSWTIFWAYVLPWMWVNHWIVMITYLHHTSPALPKYTNKSWTYLRGALATVDREPGFVLKYMLHHIIDLHVIHHLFPRIPHYYAKDATDAIKPLLGDLYHVDKQSYWAALWDTFVQCQWVEPDQQKTTSSNIGGESSDDEGILWYRAGPMPPVATSMRRSGQMLH